MNLDVIHHGRVVCENRNHGSQPYSVANQIYLHTNLLTQRVDTCGTHERVEAVCRALSNLACRSSLLSQFGAHMCVEETSKRVKSVGRHTQKTLELHP